MVALVALSWAAGPTEKQEAAAVVMTALSKPGKQKRGPWFTQSHTELTHKQGMGIQLRGHMPLPQGNRWLWLSVKSNW